MKPRMSRARLTIRAADASHAPVLDALIAACREEGRLLPRSLDDLVAHAGRFAIALRGKRVVGCAELAPLGPGVAEVRSLAVDALERGRGAGALLVAELRHRARLDGYDKLCAFTHTPGYFSSMGFSIVPHLWLPEKIATDCVKCPRFRRCGQYAMVVSVGAIEVTESVRHVPAASVARYA
jgi:amino-acid N-acetyltransferase